MREEMAEEQPCHRPQGRPSSGQLSPPNPPPECLDHMEVDRGQSQRGISRSGWSQCECWLGVPQGTHGRGHRSRLQILCD